MMEWGPPVIEVGRMIYEVITRDSIKLIAQPPRVSTRVHRLCIAESVDFAERRPTRGAEHLINIVNALEIRQPFVIVGALGKPTGEIHLDEGCEFVRIENAHGQPLPESGYRVKITKFHQRRSIISINVKQLLKQQVWLSGTTMIWVVSSSNDKGIFDRFLITEWLENEEFLIRPRDVILQDGDRIRVEYQGGSLYHRSFLQTQYGGYYNLDEGYRTIRHNLLCAITIGEGAWIYWLDGPSELPPRECARTGRVYGLGKLKPASQEGIILTETPRSKTLPKLDLEHTKVHIVEVYDETLALPAGQEETAGGQ